MVCLRFKPGVAGWKARKNPLSYSGTPKILSPLGFIFICRNIGIRKSPLGIDLR